MVVNVLINKLLNHSFTDSFKCLTILTSIFNCFIKSLSYLHLCYLGLEMGIVNILSMPISIQVLIDTIWCKNI